VVTSLNDSGEHHSRNTLHAIGHAVDLRTHSLAFDNLAKVQLGQELWENLGGANGEYDVVLEDLGGSNEHIHIEYQPHRAVKA
jgi:hypothetical protein